MPRSPAKHDVVVPVAISLDVGLDPLDVGRGLVARVGRRHRIEHDIIRPILGDLLDVAVLPVIYNNRSAAFLDEVGVFARANL